MQKYKLVFKNYLDKEEQTILLKGETEQYDELNEICFIDLFTSAFTSLQECIEYLKEHNVVTGDGTLRIQRPNGTQNAKTIIYQDDDFRTLIKEVCEKKRMGKKSTLSETSVYKKISSEVIKFFYYDEDAYKSFLKSFYTSPSFVTSLKEYIKYKNHEAFYTPYEIADREKNKKQLYDMMKKYDILREIKLWIYEYQNSKRYFNRKNPFEEYERKKDEREDNHL